MKSSQIAAAVLAALTTTTANAYSPETSMELMPEVLQKTMCVPTYVVDGKVYISSLCDASEVNKTFKLKLDETGCAVKGQYTMPDIQNGEVYEQAVVTIWAESKKELKKQMLPKCEEFDAASYWVEL